MLPRLISAGVARGFPNPPLLLLYGARGVAIGGSTRSLWQTAPISSVDDSLEFDFDVDALEEMPLGDVTSGLEAAPDKGASVVDDAPSAGMDDDISMEESIRLAEEIAAITSRQDSRGGGDIFEPPADVGTHARLGASYAHHSAPPRRTRRRPLCRGYVAKWDFEKSYAVVVDSEELPFYPDRSYVLFPSSIRFSSSDVPQSNQTLRVFQQLEFDKLVLERSNRRVAINVTGPNGAGLPPGPTSEFERKMTVQERGMSLADTTEVSSMDALPEDSIFRRDDDGDGVVVVVSPTSTLGKSPPASFRKDFYRPRSILAGQDEEVENNPSLDVLSSTDGTATPDAFTLNDFGIEVNDKKSSGQAVDRTVRSSYFNTIDNGKKAAPNAARKRAKSQSSGAKKGSFLSTQFGDSMGLTFE